MFSCTKCGKTYVSQKRLVSHLERCMVEKQTPVSKSGTPIPRPPMPQNTPPVNGHLTPSSHRRHSMPSYSAGEFGEMKPVDFPNSRLIDNPEPEVKQVYHQRRVSVSTPITDDRKNISSQIPSQPFPASIQPDNNLLESTIRSLTLQHEQTVLTLNNQLKTEEQRRLALEHSLSSSENDKVIELERSHLELSQTRAVLDEAKKEIQSLQSAKESLERILAEKSTEHVLKLEELKKDYESKLTVEKEMKDEELDQIKNDSKKDNEDVIQNLKQAFANEIQSLKNDQSTRLSEKEYEYMSEKKALILQFEQDKNAFEKLRDDLLSENKILLQKYEDDRLSYKKKIQELTKIHISELKSRGADFETTKQNLLKVISDQTEQHNIQLKVSERDIQVVRSQLATFKTIMTGMKSELDVKRNEIEVLQKDLETERDRNRVLQENIETVKQEQEKRIRDITDKDISKSLQNEIVDWSAKVASLTSQLEQQAMEKTKLTEEIRTLRESVGSRERSHDDMGRAYSDLKLKYEKSQEEHQNTAKIFLEINKSKDALSQKVEELIQEKVVILRNFESEREALKQELSTKQLEFNRVREDSENAKTELSKSFQNTIQTMKDEYLLEKQKFLNESFGNFARDLQDKTHHINELNLKIDKLQAVRQQEIIGMKENMHSQQTKILLSDQQIASLQDEIEKTKNEVVCKGGEIAKLQNDLQMKDVLIASKDEQIKTLQSKNDSSVKQQGKLEEKMLKLDESLKGMKDEYVRQQRELKLKSNELLEERKLLNEEKKKISDELGEIQEKFNVLFTSHNALKTHLEKAEDEIKKSQEREKVSSSKSDDLLKELGKRESVLIQTDDKMRILKGEMVKMAETLTTFKGVQARNQEVEEKLKNNNEMLCSYKTELIDLRAELDRVRKTLTDVTVDKDAEISNMTANMRKMQSALDNAQRIADKYLPFKKSAEESKLMMDEAIRVHLNCDAIRSDLEKKISILESQLNDQGTQITTLVATIGFKDTNIETLKKELGEVRNACDAKEKANMTRLRGEHVLAIKRYRDQIDELKARLGEK